MLPKKAHLLSAQPEPAPAPAEGCAPRTTTREALLRWLERQDYQDVDLLTAISLRVRYGKRTGSLPDNWTVADWVVWALRQQLAAEWERHPYVEIDGDLRLRLRAALTSGSLSDISPQVEQNALVGAVTQLIDQILTAREG